MCASNVFRDVDIRCLCCGSMDMVSMLRMVQERAGLCLLFWRIDAIVVGGESKV